MAKPPQTPPASDLEGVDRDKVPNTDTALASGQDAKDLARARKEAAGKPDYRDDEKNRDDRSR